MPPADNQPSSQPSRDQVILPLRVAFGICLRSISARLSRSLVTLFGVSLGIAFLMSTATGFHIKQALQEDAAMAREVERRVVMLRSEIGRLQGKRLAVALGKPTVIDTAFIEALKSNEATLQELKAVNASAVLLLGDYGPLLTPDIVSHLTGKPVFDFQFSTHRASQPSLSIKHLNLDLRPDEIAAAKNMEMQAQYRVYWLVGISLLITIIGIANAMLMSVTERIREIGTMKCLGALPSFIVKLFLIESCLTGLAGAILGSLGGALFSLLAFSCTFGLVNVWTSVSYPTLALIALLCSLVGVFLAVLAGIYPARVAAKMIPASALTSNV